MPEKGIIWSIIIGFIAGVIAKFITPGRDPLGFIMTTVLGIAGAWLATWLGQMIGWYKTGEVGGFIAAIVGAVILLSIWHIIRRKSTT